MSNGFMKLNMNYLNYPLQNKNIHDLMLLTLLLLLVAKITLFEYYYHLMKYVRRLYFPLR